jgi:hypothetical protein
MTAEVWVQLSCLVTVVSAVAVGQMTSRAIVFKLLVSADQLQIFSNFVDILPKIMSTRGPLCDFPNSRDNGINITRIFTLC